MTRTKLSTSLLLAPLLTFAAACDADDETVDEDRSAEADVDDDADGDAHPHASHGFDETKREVMLGLACEQLDCTEDQRDKLGDLMTSMHELKQPDPARTEAREEANQRFADAFRGDDFNAGDVANLRTHMEGEFDLIKAKMFGAALELHAILDGEQREKVASLLESGPRGFKGMRGKHGKHGGFGMHHDMDPAARHAKMAERGAEHLCAKIECEGDQQAALAKVMLDNAPEMKREEFEGMRSAMADTFRSPKLDRAALQTRFAEFEPVLRQKMGQLEAMPVEIHAILTPDQRAIISDELIAKGPAVFGPGGHHRRGGHHGFGH